MMALRACAAALALAGSLALPGGSRAQTPGQGTTTLVLRVLDDASGRPVAGAQVTVSGTPRGASADRKGVARISDVPAGARVVRVTSLGYAGDSLQVAFEAGVPVDAELRLAPAPVPLTGIVAAGEAGQRTLQAKGFYERARLGGATFIAGERLAKLARRTNRLSAAFDNVPGVRATLNGRGTGMVLVSTRSSRGESFSGEQCYPIIYLDDVKVKYDFGGKAPYENADLNNLVPLGDVVGIEVYQGISNVPYQYDRNPCGVVLIWTRSAP